MVKLGQVLDALPTAPDWQARSQPAQVADQRLASFLHMISEVGQAALSKLAVLVEYLSEKVNWQVIAG